MSDPIKVSISEKPLSVNEAVAFVSAPEQGAVATFVGAVRNHNLGKAVSGVSYDLFEPLTLKTFEEICVEVREKWGEALHLFVSHFKGRLEVGGISIVIATSSPHRDEAFQACRFIIEEIKQRSPIWKKEHYLDGDSEWVKGHALCSHK